MYNIVGNLWEQLCIKSLSSQPLLYQHLWYSQEAMRESMRTGNIEIFPPQNCIRTAGNRFGKAEATYLLCFRGALGVFHPEDYL